MYTKIHQKIFGRTWEFGSLAAFDDSLAVHYWDAPQAGARDWVVEQRKVNSARQTPVAVAFDLKRQSVKKCKESIKSNTKEGKDE